MPRPRSTQHCHDCKHLTQIGALGILMCEQSIWPITKREARTSPKWCPRGHVIPGEAYPTFTPGKDPRGSAAVHASLFGR